MTGHTFDVGLGPHERDVIDARLIFDKILEGQAPQLEEARVVTRVEDHLSGDLVLLEESEEGRQFFLVGDFTGHGLCAAIGTLLASQIFRAMVRKGFSPRRIAQELDEKVARLLPTGRFMAAALIALDPADGQLEVWNAALPEILVWRPAAGIVARFPSTHPPLGILGAANAVAPFTEDLQPDDRVVAMTDGLVEAPLPDGAFLGRAWLEAAVAAGPIEEDGWLVDALLDRFDATPARLRDDLSLLEVKVVPKERRSGTTASLPAAPWRCDLWFTHAQLARGLNPIPSVLGTLREQVDLHERSKRAAGVILSELYTNALEHGLLAMDSTLKDLPDGMLVFADRRAERLAELTEGSIRITLVWTPGELRIRVEHDGTGFDPAKARSSLVDNDRPYGRGLAMVRQLCRSLTYSDGGRTAEAALTLD